MVLEDLIGCILANDLLSHKKECFSNSRGRENILHKTT